MEQREYWNGVAETKVFTTPFHVEDFEAMIPKESFVLDVGCGYGRTMNELHELGYAHLLGMDFSAKMLERGKKEFPYLDLRIMEPDKLDLPDNSVDAVILFAVLTCISSDQAQKELIEEIKRVLKPGGVIYVNDFLLNSDERNLKRYNEFEEKYGVYGVFELAEGAILRHHSEEWVRKLLECFEKCSYEHLVFTTMNGNKSNGFCFFGKKKSEV